VTGTKHIGGNRLTLLARAGELLSAAGAGERTLEKLAALLVRGFADWCAIDVLNEDGSIDRAACAPDDGPPLRTDRPHGPAVVMRTGEPELVRGVTDELMPGTTSYLCVPLMSRDRPWGAITLATTGEREFGPADLDLAAELARRAASTVETSRLLRSLAHSEERYRLLFEANPLPMRAARADRLRGRAGSRSHAPAARLQPPPGATSASARAERHRGRDGADGATDHRRRRQRRRMCCWR
jgi:GAF domain